MAESSSWSAWKRASHMSNRILVLGAGFAGLWAAAGAMRKIVEHKAEREVAVTVVNRTSHHRHGNME